MKIGVAQNRPVKGNISENIEGHKKLIQLAVAFEAEALFFPELSLTGYEPTLASQLVLNLENQIFTELQNISDTHKIRLGVGIPTRNSSGICISMAMIQPKANRYIHSKKYLHVDEEPYFVSGETATPMNVGDLNIGLAICYEILVQQHTDAVFKNGANIYVASVAKTEAGAITAHERLSQIAKTQSVYTLMANCVGPSDDFVSVGRSGIWSESGDLLVELNDIDEGVLVLDTVTGEVFKKTL
ncbi:MAG: carbon-nitrogen hydrolase family protein [Cyclobacteriaceae bacterium]